MSWERFEDRKINNPSMFIVTLMGSRTAYLGFNSRVRTQLLRGHPYVDLFFDRERAVIGLRFLAAPNDINTYKIANYGQGSTSEARICMTRFFKRSGLFEKLKGHSYHAELHSDPAEGMWWFSVEKLMNGARSHSRDSGNLVESPPSRG